MISKFFCEILRNGSFSSAHLQTFMAHSGYMSALSVSAMAALGSILSTFVRTNEMRSFFWSMTFGDWKKNLANGKKIAKIQHNYLAKFSSFKVGETEWRILRRQDFAWHTKFGEIDHRRNYLNSFDLLEVSSEISSIKLHQYCEDKNKIKDYDNKKCFSL